MSAANWGRLLALAALWGMSFPLIKTAVRDIPPLTVVLGRVSIAALALGLLMLVTRTPFPRGRKAWTAFIGMGLTNNLIPWGLQFWGQQELSVGLASILNAATPAFSVVVMHVLNYEKATASRAAGVLFGFAGVAVLIGPSILFSSGHQVLPELAFMLACLLYAISGLFGRRFGRLGLNTTQTTFGLMSATSVMAIPVAFIANPPWTLAAPSMSSAAALLVLALVSTAFAFTLFFRILVEAGATNVMLVTLLVPITAIMISVSFMGETVEPRNLAGMALIGLGLLCIDGRAPAALYRLASGGTAP